MFNIEKLEKFQVYVKIPECRFMTVRTSITDGFASLLLFINESSETKSESIAVSTSIFMRRYGFFIAAQLYLFAHNKIWDGPLEEIHIAKNGGSITFEIDPCFIRDTREGDIEKVIKYYGHTVVKAMSKNGNISNLTLWENIWGYVLWMYSFTETNKAKTDLLELLSDHVWKPDMRTSVFRKLLNGRTFEDASAYYQRVTCCLLKEVPGTNPCPYCPNLKK